MSYLEVAVAAPISHTLTYKGPQPSSILLQAGLRLLVPLGRRQVTGYVLAISSRPPETDYQLKEISDILDQEPLFPAAMVPFFRWLADYYQYPIGEIIKGALPGGLAPQSARKISLTKTGADFFSCQPAEKGFDRPWFKKLLDKQELSTAATATVWRSRKDSRLIRQWEADGLIHIQEEITKDRVRDKTELCVQLVDNTDHVRKLKVSEQKTLHHLTQLTKESERPWVSSRDLNKSYAGAGRALAALQKQGLIMMEEQKIYRNPFGEIPPFYPKPEILTPDQQRVMRELVPAIRTGEFAAYLLHGVTGSGKTEIYLQAAEHALQAKRSVLVLVPEIALASQIEGNFLTRFGERIALLHSGLSAGERLDQWKRIAGGQAKIVIGARSALFAPLAEPGLIIVDEEHDGAYKQEDGFCYQARDAAVLRAKQVGAVVVLGSATPSITSFQHARTGKYKLLSMPVRVAERQLPEVEVIDLKSIKTITGQPPLFSPQLITALKENLRQGCQSLIFLNRRGYANLMLCRSCGHTLQCANCQVSLTLHKGRRELICHYCGSSIKSAALCPKCQSTELIEIGFGTERIEDELRKILPQARIARLDRDTAASRKQYIKILKAVHQQQIDILVGTQMIAKGHHFPHVTLVGVIWADASLAIPDYKAGERTFQLLTQVFGRAGRGEIPGQVLVQTHHPEHYSINNSKSHNYEDMFNEEINLRHALKFPPFSRLINLRFAGEKEEAVSKAARQVAEIARQNCRPHIEVLGPAPAPLSRLRGMYRWQLLLKSADLPGLHALSAHLKTVYNGAGFTTAVKLTVDVDPENML